MGRSVKAVRRMNPNTTLETLIPDFQGIEKHLGSIIDVAPEVVSHNMKLFVDSLERYVYKPNMTKV